MDNNSLKPKLISFTIPSNGNRITANDIKNKQIRVTAAFKGLFPEEDDELKITINNTYRLAFKHRGKRSHILRLGSEALEELGIKAGDTVKFTQIEIKNYKIEGVK